MSERLEAGKYFCRVVEQDLRTSKKGNWMVVLDIEPLLFEAKGAKDPSPVTEVPEGNKLIYYGTITKGNQPSKSLPFVQRELEALGFKGEKPSDIRRKDNGADVRNSENWWVLTYQNSPDGDDFEKWKPETPRESAGPSEVTETQLMELDALLSDSFGGYTGFTETDL